MREKRAWTMPADETRTCLQQVASSDIEVTHRDVLIRLWSVIEEDLEAGAISEQSLRRSSFKGRYRSALCGTESS
jgi:hypothetical protein